jgi:acyl-CoA reductase-like NAD-dependent aldehyde dehydrogenase
VVGEFSLIDGQPRSANVVAHSDVEARWLAKESFECLCREQPEAGAAILGALGRQLTAKLRQQNLQLAEFMSADEADTEVRQMVAEAVAAQKAFAATPEAEVDALLADVAETISKEAPRLAEVNVADTGIGLAADKVQKIRFACTQVPRTLIGQHADGVLRENPATRVVDIASAMGVILGIIPVTNPVSTITFKTLICLKSRNALVLSCHRDALRVGGMTGDLIHSALRRHGAPPALVQWVKTRTDRKKTAMLMRHPDVAFILATGGPSIVAAAYSSGKPAIGVGAGNAPVLICADADLAAAARRVVHGKSFDHGVICGSENNLVVEQAVHDAFVRELESAGAMILTPDEKHRFTAHVFDFEHGSIKREFVGKSAAHLVRDISLREEASAPQLIVFPADLDERSGPYGHEKLAPILSLFTVADFNEGITLCRLILEQQGQGHTAIIHTGSEELARRFGREMPASRVLVNVPGSTGCIGVGTGLTPSFTLGCGTDGGNSTTDNVTFTHLLNIKRLALGLPTG